MVIMKMVMMMVGILMRRYDDGGGHDDGSDRDSGNADSGGNSGD